MAHGLTTTSPAGPRNRISRRFSTSRPKMRSLPMKSAWSWQGYSWPSSQTQIRKPIVMATPPATPLIIPGTPWMISGVAGGVAMTMGFLIWVWLDGQEYPCQLQADFIGSERILGRDVLNRLEILFRGPAGEVVVNP